MSATQPYSTSLLRAAHCARPETLSLRASASDEDKERSVGLGAHLASFLRAVSRKSLISLICFGCGYRRKRHRSAAVGANEPAMQAGCNRRPTSQERRSQCSTHHGCPVVDEPGKETGSDSGVGTGVSNKTPQVPHAALGRKKKNCPPASKFDSSWLPLLRVVPGCSASLGV